MGVKPSDADLSEDDFMQSNGEQVEEPAIQKFGIEENAVFKLLFSVEMWQGSRWGHR